MNSGEILELVAQVVAISDEIRKNIAAKGAEAEAQFNAAVERNRKSFGDIVKEHGGDWPAGK